MNPEGGVRRIPISQPKNSAPLASTSALRSSGSSSIFDAQSSPPPTTVPSNLPFNPKRLQIPISTESSSQNLNPKNCPPAPLSRSHLPSPPCSQHRILPPAPQSGVPDHRKRNPIYLLLRKRMPRSAQRATSRMTRTVAGGWNDRTSAASTRTSCTGRSEKWKRKPRPTPG